MEQVTQKQQLKAGDQVGLSGEMFTFKEWLTNAPKSGLVEMENNWEKETYTFKYLIKEKGIQFLLKCEDGTTCSWWPTKL